MKTPEKNNTPAAAGSLVEQSAQEIQTGSSINQAAVLLETLKRAVDEGKDIETLERLLQMSERIQDRQAQQDFWSDFHQARAEMPKISARGKNQTTNSTYALMEDVQAKIVPVYTRFGFNMIFSTDVSPLEGHTRIIAQVTHRGGHSESYSTDLPIDDVGMKGTRNKTPIHATGSAHKYGQRYLTTLVWNVEIVKNPLDDDGNAAGAEPIITDEQAANLDALFTEVGGDLEKFLKPYNCASIDQMPQKFFKRAIDRLEQKRAS